MIYRRSRPDMSGLTLIELMLAVALVATGFVLLLGELIIQLRHPASEEQAELIDMLDGAISLRERDPMVDPVTFYQMFEIMKTGELPSMKDLSEALHMSKATMTRTVEQWVSEGFVKRVHDIDDRRIIRIALTDQGKKVYDIMRSYAEKRVGSILNNLTGDEQLMLVRLLTRLTRT